MKKRTGFVSNSSSSSFIASLNDFESTLDIAKAMIPLRAWDSRDKELLSVVGNIIAPRDLSLFFSTCNYDTRIYVDDLGTGKDMYVIDTCNNHSFGYDIDEFEFMPEKLNDYKSENSITRKQQYLDLESQIFIEELEFGEVDDESDFCDKHKRFYVRLADGINKGKITCSLCCLEEQEKREKEEGRERELKSRVDFNNNIETYNLNELLGNAINVASKIKEGNQDKFDITVKNAVRDIAMGLTGQEIKFV